MNDKMCNPYLEMVSILSFEEEKRHKRNEEELAEIER